ncbi:MAG: plastocyanin/azurin family copper-binding protein [Candidatus Poseidoniaceae archaeon]
MRAAIVVTIVLLLLQGNLTLEEEQETEVHVVTVDSTNLRFTPSALTINEGDTLRFVWGGQALPHNSVEENGVFDSGDPERAVDYGHVFDYDSAGTYSFFCEPHEAVGMTGSVTVLDVEAPAGNDSDNQIGSSTGESEASTPNVRLGLALGLFALLAVAMWRARIYD